MDELERAMVEGARITLFRRGTEYVVTPKRIRSRGSTEQLVGTTNAGDDLSFSLDEIEYFDVI
jgi:hypothetical protein